MLNDPRLAEEDDKEKDGGDAGMMKRMLKTRSILVFEPISDKLARRVQSTLLLLQQDDELVLSNDGGKLRFAAVKRP